MKTSKEMKTLRKILYKIVPIFILLNIIYVYFVYSEFKKHNGVVEFGTSLFTLIAFITPLVILTTILTVTLIVVSVLGFAVKVENKSSEDTTK